MKNDPLGDKCKSWENVTRMYLPKKTYSAIRIDGKSFSTYTKHLKKPFDMDFIAAMAYTTKALCESVQNAFIGYHQSDEITLLMADFENENTEPWFGGNVLKQVSVSASMATNFFNHQHRLLNGHRNKPAELPLYMACFDSRAFSLPDEDAVYSVLNWRLIDATRNSIFMLARQHFSDKQLHLKRSREVQQMLLDNGVDWESLECCKKRGNVIRKVAKVTSSNVVRKEWEIDWETPDWLKDRTYLPQFIPSKPTEETENGKLG